MTTSSPLQERSANCVSFLTLVFLSFRPSRRLCQGTPPHYEALHTLFVCVGDVRSCGGTLRSRHCTETNVKYQDIELNVHLVTMPQTSKNHKTQISLYYTSLIEGHHHRPMSLPCHKMLRLCISTGTNQMSLLLLRLLSVMHSLSVVGVHLANKIYLALSQLLH